MRQAIVIKNPKWEPYTVASDAFKASDAPSVLIVRGRCKEKKLKDKPAETKPKKSKDQ